jgi:hypothetical protein
MRAASSRSSTEVPAPGSAAHAMSVHRDPESGCDDRQEAMSTPRSEPFTDENVWRTVWRSAAARKRRLLQRLVRRQSHVPVQSD